MKYFILSVIVLWLALPLAGQDLTRTVETKPGLSLEVDLDAGGSVKVTGWTKNQVEVKAYFNGDVEEEDIEIRENSKGVLVAIEGGNWNGRGNHSVDLVINVPVNFNIEIETMGGSIELDNLNGKFDGQTMGGSLEFSQLHGEVNFTTMGGSIEVSESDLEGRLKTMGGSIEFDNVSGDVNASTMGGSIEYRNVQGNKSSKKAVEVSTMGGGILIDDAPNGAKVSTMGGEINIRKAGVFVDASTMGGEINLDEIDGAVKASTMGGDVVVKVIGDGSKAGRDISLSSKGGDITLTLPANTSAGFELELVYSRYNRDREKYRISSDFKLDTEDEKGDNERKSRRITAAGKSGDGKNRVKISTIDGNITIKKQ